MNWITSSPEKFLQREKSDRRSQLEQFAVTAEQMVAIEGRVFAAGMPVAALMEKVALRIADRIQSLYPPETVQRVGVLVGPGHNGGDALVVARELYFAGYNLTLFCPFDRLKELTEQHLHYARSVGISTCDRVSDLAQCDLLIDGLFGFGLTRPLEGAIAAAIDTIRDWSTPVISIDIPSGLHTDSGAVLGTAVRADYTLCLGLWKRAFLQDHALEYVGKCELIDFDLPLTDIHAVLGQPLPLRRITSASAIAQLPLHRSPTSHKYKAGHLLLVCGSRQYMGAAILAGRAACASGVGMLSIAVPQTLISLLIAQLPDALILGCPETETGAIAQLPAEIDLQKYSTIACGPGLTTAASTAVQQVMTAPCPLVLDADGLNIVVAHQLLPTLSPRSSPTILTPHPGEFKRLFPDLLEASDPITAVQQASDRSGLIVLHKGARVAIGAPHSGVAVNPDSTPALARGGSGDVLTGLLGGLLAQKSVGRSLTPAEAQAVTESAVWWHAQAGIWAAQQFTELGVDASTLARSLSSIARFISGTN